MKNEMTYYEKNARDHTELIRKTLMNLPPICTDFIRSISQSTSTLTRLAYSRDLKLFFTYLQNEVPEFSGISGSGWTMGAISTITSRHMELYLDYLSLYYSSDDVEYTNAELGKMRKLSTLRSFYNFLFKNGHVPANVSELVEMPKRHEKPILRMEIDEVARLLDIVESGDALSDRQKRFHEKTKLRDTAMLTLFLGTGIRVSECVGLNIEDIDFEVNGFTVTRKGGNQVILYFPEEVAEVVSVYLIHREKMQALPGHERALFLSLQNRRITVRAVENLVKKYALLAAPLKKKLSPHKLRSTFGTNLYHETGDIYLVADVLGHSDVNTTRRHYAAMSDDRRRKAARSVKLRGDTPEKKEK